MLEEATRPFTRAEQRLLRSRSAMPEVGSVFWMQDERRVGFWTIGIALCVILLGALLSYTVVGAVIGIGFVLVRFNSYRERRRLRKHMLSHKQKLVEELEAGNAYAIACRPARIIEREEFEDEGAFWIFDGGNGSYLALCGQEYYETPRFPSAHFEIVMGARHKSVIGIRSKGLRIPSTQVVSGKDIAWEMFPAKNITLFHAPANAELPAILSSLAAASTG
jgi:hypothetical protein